MGLLELYNAADTQEFRDKAALVALGEFMRAHPTARPTLHTAAVWAGAAFAVADAMVEARKAEGGNNGNPA